MTAAHQFSRCKPYERMSGSVSQNSVVSSAAGVGIVMMPASADGDSALTDAGREAAIVTAGRAIERHMQARRDAILCYEVSGCMTDAGAADRALLMAREAERLMVALINARSAAYVAKLEAERGLT